MRKTLTAILVVLAAGSLAACKMPWDKAETPPPATVAATTETPTPDPVADTTTAPETPKPAEQTASTDKPAQTPAVPATK